MHVPVGVYAQYTCGQLSSEMQRIVRRHAELAGVQDENARADAMKVGLATTGLALAGAGGAVVVAGSSSVVGTSALGLAGGATLGATSFFFTRGDDAKTSQLALLKGELDAAERSFVEKDCNNTARIIRTRG